MEVVIAAPEELVALAAGAIESLLAAKPAGVLGLATGSSPLGIYDELVRRHRDGRVSFARARGFLLDEYVGLPVDHPERYRNVIEQEIASRVDFAPGAVQGPDGLADDIAAACVRYEAAIAEAGGVDLQILGIGTDGHVGFNEPGSSLASRTRIKTLTGQTRTDNARFFDGDVEASRQGRGDPPPRRGPCQCHVARDDPAAPPARQRAHRPRCGGQAAARRLLPQHLRSEAGLAGALTEPTRRAREVAALVGAGPSDEEICEQLIISGATAKTRVSDDHVIGTPGRIR